MTKALRSHLAAGGRLPASHKDPADVSLIGVCELVDGIDYEDVVEDHHVRKLLAQLRLHPGVLGKPWDPSRYRFSLPAQLDLVLRRLDEWFQRGVPLPERPGHPGKVDHRAIRCMVRADGPPVVLCGEYKERIRRHLAPGAPGVANLDAPPAAPIPSIEDVVGKIQDLLAAEREAKGRDPSGGRHELKTAIGRALVARGFDWQDDWPDDLFADLNDLKQAAALAGRPLSETSARNMRTQLDIAARLAPEASRVDDGLPTLAHACLSEAIRRSGKTLVQLELASQVPGTNKRIPALLLCRLSRGACPLPQKYLECLPHLEEALGIPGALSRRWTASEDVRNLECTPYYRSLSSEMRRVLPKGSHLLTDEQLRPLVQERRDKVFRLDTMYSKCCRVSRKVNRHLPPLPSNAPLRTELALLIKHKTAAVPLDAQRRAAASWTPATVKLAMNRLIRLARFALMAREHGGLGKSLGDVSLALILNWHVLAAYLNWRAGRYAQVVHEGVRRGPVLTEEDICLLGLCVSLLDPRFGWVRQRRALFAKRVKEDATEIGAFRWLEELRVRHRSDDEKPLLYSEHFDDAFSSDSLGGAVTPAALVSLAKKDWSEACLQAHNRLSNLRSYLTRLVDKSRDPFDAIRVIVYDEERDPLSFVKDIVTAALRDLPDRSVRPFEHAVAVRDLLMFTLTAVTALRSRNIRRLRFDPNGGGHVSFTKDGTLLTIPWWEFKNMGSEHLFGRWSNKMDYQRLVKDWYNFDAMLQHFLKHCRPILIERYAAVLLRDASPEDAAEGKVRQTTDALFPVPSLEYMTESGLHFAFRQITQRYHVIDPATGLVRPGYMPFGPHAMRDIVAMHIVLASDGEERWAEAADLLQTSPDMVRYRYTKRLIVERTGKADHHFDQSTRGVEAFVFS